MASVNFALDGDSYTVQFNYDPDVVAILEDIPHFARKWRPATRSWWIFGYWAGSLASELDAHGHTVTGIDPAHWRGHGSQHSGARQYGYAADDWAKILFARVGPERADAVFRSLTRILHPDNLATGDAALQRDLNTARAETEKS